ncbi:hypothetical protein FQA39_LY14190 [Lamprigera yunnana]|nr:hypothetical protein FQA39_LY14190 [Lamprigera yunnana]
MDVDCNESYPIKMEVIIKETFSCEKFKDSESEEFKIEAVDFKESFKCEEQYNLGLHINISDVLIPQYINNECNFITKQKDALLDHLKITKNVQYFCKECNINTWFSCSIKEHFRIHDSVACRHITKTCTFKRPQLKTPLKGRLKAHVKIYTGAEYKCKQCDYKTQWKQSLKKHRKIHSGDIYVLQNMMENEVK